MWGATALHIDDDGLVDIAASINWNVDGAREPVGALVVFKNVDGSGKFENVAMLGSIDDGASARTPVALDYDGDGNMDIFVTSKPHSRLWRGDGNGSFDEVDDLNALRRYEKGWHAADLPP